VIAEDTPATVATNRQQTSLYTDFSGIIGWSRTASPSRQHANTAKKIPSPQP